MKHVHVHVWGIEHYTLHVHVCRCKQLFSSQVVGNDIKLFDHLNSIFRSFLLGGVIGCNPYNNNIVHVHVFSCIYTCRI